MYRHSVIATGHGIEAYDFVIPTVKVQCRCPNRQFRAPYPEHLAHGDAVVEERRHMMIAAVIARCIARSRV